MFTWDKSLRKIDAPAARILHLFHSMRDVQVALPGLPVQQTSAYLCQYAVATGVATVAVLHLQKSQRLAFYRCEPAVAPREKAESLFAHGLGFVESMGFLLSDMDLHLLEEADRRMLWESLPLATGLETEATEKEAAALPSRPAPAPRVERPVPPAASQPQDVEDLEVVEVVEGQDAVAEDPVDDLLAAVQVLRGKRSALPSRRQAPRPAELARRRLELRENLGRMLASL